MIQKRLGAKAEPEGPSVLDKLVDFITSIKINMPQIEYSSIQKDFNKAFQSKKDGEWNN